MNNETILILCGLAGVLFHCVAKCKTLLDDARAGNVDFHWLRDYVYKDYLGIVLSILSVGMWFLIFGEVIASYPTLEGFARTSFVVMGVMGSWAFQLFFSRAKRLIRAQVDAKTNALNVEQGNPIEQKTTI